MSTEILQAGRRVSDREVTVTDGSRTRLSALARERGLVLYFYPKDNTPGCTREACAFRDHNAELARLGYGVVGVSADSVASHQKFTTGQKLNFPLIVDADRALASEFGVYGEKQMYGKTVTGIIRSTFVLTRDLTIRHAYPAVRVDGHVERVLADLGGAPLAAAPVKKSASKKSASAKAASKKSAAAKSVAKPASRKAASQSGRAKKKTSRR